MIVTLKRLSYVKESYCALQGIVHPLSSSCVSILFRFAPHNRNGFSRNDGHISFRRESHMPFRKDNHISYVVSNRHCRADFRQLKRTLISKLNIEQKIILNCIH